MKKETTCRLLVVLLLLLVSSCVNLRHNYLGVAKRDLATVEVEISQKAKLDSIRSSLNNKADSLLKSIQLTKQHNRHLTAGEINQLYANFGSQLNYDRYYNALMQMGKVKKKRLTLKQRNAAVRLLYSALEYNRSYQCNKFARRALNRGDIGNQIPHNVLQKSRKFLYSPSIRRKLTGSKDGSRLDFADSLLLHLPKTNFFKSAYYTVFRNNDRLYGLVYNVFPTVGQSLFGNVGERITNRSKQKQNAKLLLSVLKPYDILLSRSPGHLTAKVIPGYFGHAALWFGTEVPHKRKPFLGNLLKKDTSQIGIRQKGIAEALRNGVQMSRLIEYADADEYVIIRPRTLTKGQKHSIAENAMKQMGKSYDFNFDIESADMINCTELVFLAYDFVNWETHYFLGRYTLFPDDLLLTTVNKMDLFEIAAYVKDGKVMLTPDIKEIGNLIR